MRRTAALLAFLVAASALLAGCLGGPDAGDAAVEPANTTVQIDEDRPEATFGDVATGPSAVPDAAATLEAPPQLEIGEWWRVKFSSPLTGETAEYVRVVADIQGDVYVVGMPHEGWYKEAVLYHTPGFGDVNKDLSYFTHDEIFQPIRFPIVDGDTWETTFSGSPPLTAETKLNGDGTATITFTGPSLTGGTTTALEAVYDPSIHEICSFNHFTAQFEVVDHGYGFEGWITIPRGEDLVFFHGRIGPALDIGLQPALPTETVNVSGGFNRLSFFLSAGGLVGPTTSASPGVFRETAVAPDGTKFESLVLPGQPRTFDMYEFPDPDGDWQLEHLVAGAGAAFIEGIAYHQYDIRLPDGARRSDHSHEVIR